MGNSQKKAQENFEKITQGLAEGIPLKEFNGISDKSMEAIYATAFNLYESGKYVDSEKIFRFLCINDQYEKKYFIGLGACRQMLKAYKSAVDCYSHAAILDSTDPQIAYHAGCCHLALEDYTKAVSGFTAAVRFAGEDPRHAAIKKEASGKLLLAQQQLNKGGQGEPSDSTASTSAANG